MTEQMILRLASNDDVTVTDDNGRTESESDRQSHVAEDDTPINLESENNNPANSTSDVALLELGDSSAPQAISISLEEPPLPESELVSSPTRSRSRSSSRLPRRRSSRHRHHRWRNRFQLKKKESNFLAAACSMAVIVLLCTAMAESEWWYVRGGGCRQTAHDTSLHYIGLNQFFYMGSFLQLEKSHDNSPNTYYNYGPNPEDALIDCVTPQTVQVIRSIIALCSLGVLCTILSFLLDLHGPSVRVLKTIQRHAILSICTVVICVALCGFCYWVSQLVQVLQIKTKPHAGNKIQVEFSIGFYLVAAAGSMAVLSTACSLLRKNTFHDDDQRDRLLEDYDAFGLPSDPYGPVGFMSPPPPPPYSP